jgi:hypothetical protein
VWVGRDNAFHAEPFLAAIDAGDGVTRPPKDVTSNASPVTPTRRDWPAEGETLLIVGKIGVGQLDQGNAVLRKEVATALVVDGPPAACMDCLAPICPRSWPAAPATAAPSP